MEIIIGLLALNLLVTAVSLWWNATESRFNRERFRMLMTRIAPPERPRLARETYPAIIRGPWQA